MRNRCPEQGKDAIAQGLSHIALITVDSIHHELQGGIDNGAGFFWIEPFDECCGPFEVGKQRRDGFALAVGCPTGFQRGLLGADTFGKMRRGVGCWGLGTWNLKLGT